MIYGEHVDPIPSENIPIADDRGEDREPENEPTSSSEPRVRFSEVAGAVGSHQALRLLCRAEGSS